MFDVLIVNGRVVDGTGNPPFRADVAIAGGKIAAVGKLAGATAATTIDARGQIVCPGFIDIHSHADWTLLVDPRAESAVRQGVTTVVLGNCGHSAAPLRSPSDVSNVVLGYLRDDGVAVRWRRFGEYLDVVQQRRPAVNVASLVGHNAVRVAAMGYETRPATEDEVAAMQRLVAEALDDGAVGFSTGLEYTPGNSATTEEIVALCRVAADRDKFYATHVRQRDYQALEAAREAFQIVEASGVRLLFSHMPPRVWAPRRAAEEMLGMIERAAERGLDASFDSIVYTWGASTLAGGMLPRWAFEGGIQATLARLRDPAARERIKAHRTPMFKSVVTGHWDKLVLYYSERNPQYCGRTFAEIGRDRGKDPHDAILDVMAEEGEGLYGMMWAGEAFDEREMAEALRHPLCIIESDGLTLAHDGPLARMHHPFTYGWTARALGQYVREQRLMPLEEAIRKMTSFPAQKLGLRDRGLLREGLWADVVVFDPSTVRDNTTLADPDAYPSGFSWVLVNGQVVFDGHRQTEARPGAVLRC